MQRVQTKRRKQLKRRGKLRRLAASAGAGRGSAELLQWYRPVKRKVSLRLDADVLAWFQRKGRGYQTRINRVLREAMREEQDGSVKGTPE